MELQALLLVCLAALFVGFAKTGVPGSGILIVPLMAIALETMGTKASVGYLLPLLIVGDVFAVCYYRRHAQWAKLWKLFPWVAPGIIIGALTLDRIHSDTLRILLGCLVLVLLTLELIRQRAGWNNLPHTTWFAASTGIAGGFATTVGNAAGSIMNIYFLSMELPKKEFIGTQAWFFMIVNWLKVPIFVKLGMITGETIAFDAKLVPLIAIGAFLGIKLVPRIPQTLFNRLILALAAVASLELIFNWTRFLTD